MNTYNFTLVAYGNLDKTSDTTVNNLKQLLSVA